MTETTTIVVSATTRANIEKFREHPRDTIDDILSRLIIIILQKNKGAVNESD